MVHSAKDRSWIEAFYDSAVEWWGESWYEGVNLKPRLEGVERFVGKPPKNLLELGAEQGRLLRSWRRPDTGSPPLT